MPKLLLTGAAGIVGTAIRPLLAARNESLALTDLKPVSDLAANESFVAGDIADLKFVRSLITNVEAIIHLAGMVGPDYTFDEVLGPNIVGTYNVFAAAKAAGIRRVINASSHHTVGFHRRGDHVDHQTAPRPDSHYGLSKAFGESTASFFADKYDIQTLSIRIGFVGDKVIDERRLHTWISPRDLVQLIDIGLTTPKLGHQIVYGISDNPGSFFDNANAAALGYRPQDRSLDHLAHADLAETRPDLTSPVGTHIGGHFAAGEF